jgi:ABC-type uncharacterized transport system auxiliary subunit
MSRGALPLACAACLLLAACGPLLPERAAQTYFRLDDTAAAPSPSGTTGTRSIVIAAVPNDAAGNAYGMLYSRARGERAFYQHAEWTDRPTPRVAQLLLERLQAHRAFAGVVRLGSGAAGDVLVNVAVEEVLHDLAAGGAGEGRIVVSIEVIDRGARSLLDRRRFVHAAPAASATAAAAAAAVNRALAALLDEAVPWVEAVAAKAPSRRPD